MKYKSLFGILLILSLTACANEEIKPTITAEDDFSSAIVLKDIRYGNAEAQEYDLYLPANRSAEITRVLVFIHGGGWIQGDKTDMEQYIPLLQESHPSHAIANLNYRLAEPPLQAAFPNQFLDVKQALEQISEDAEQLGIKAEFGLIGVSAGGHLALQYDSVYDTRDRVKLVCSIVGPSNLTDAYYAENPDFEKALNFLVDENAYPGITNYAKAVSPVFFVNENSSATILFYGEEDPLVPLSNGEFLHERLNLNGIINSFTIYDGSHGDWAEQDHNDMHRQLSEFIDLHLAVE